MRANAIQRDGIAAIRPTQQIRHAVVGLVEVVVGQWTEEKERIRIKCALAAMCGRSSFVARGTIVVGDALRRAN